ncbi:endonuclease/exonuclease/phosphatase family protein [Gelidibacter salicanalis]|uniref:endonuclease/exonuclease/phosphatase family protein n=1 Tax=Gelidibacter salicanalis TaxID=291193 RepID=UPI001FEA5F73|nr:endonuclease/exonuclease/phosphatase family protein [Gelidibacter salicanalis]
MSLQHPNSDTHTIAFYNTENLFDHLNDPLIMDTDFLEIANKKWSKERYEIKIYKTGKVISKIGFEELQHPPTIIGLAEVENDKVLTDLIESEHLKPHNYGFVHYNSPDERGIDVAMLYDKTRFRLDASETITLNVANELGVRDYTRDILKVSGYLNDQKIHVLVNHWPSRHQESDATGQKRMYAAQRVIDLMNDIQAEDADAKIIVMGDFNDNPKNDSIQFLKQQQSLFNPMETLLSFKRGSANHNNKWILFDQILVTRNLLEPQPNGLQYIKADIFDDDFLTQLNGKNKGQPFRTYVGKKYKGGYSDHFPVYIQVKETSR